MNGGKPAGPEVEEGPGRAGKATSIGHPKYTMERPGWDTSQDGKEKPSRGMEERWEAQWQKFLRTLQPLHTGGGSPGMPETAPWEDTKAFLASFEQVAKACRWPRGEWAARLLPALSGEAEEAFRRLEARDQEDYGRVKAAVLRGEALRREAQRQHFRQFCCPEVRDPRRIHSQVQELCRQWLKPERHSKEQIVELLILEQFLASLPVELQGWIRAGGPDTCSQAVALAEDFLTSQQVAEPGTWQGPLKEEFEDSLEAEEEPSDPVQGQIYEEPKQNGSGIKFPSFSNSSLLPEEQEMDQTDVKEEEMKLHRSRLCLQIVSQSLPLPALQTTVWQVLQEDGGNVEPSGDRKGRKVKMENCQYGGNEPQDTSGKASQRGRANVLETDEMHKAGCEPKKGQETEGREDECHEVTEELTAPISPPSKGRTRDNMPMFSKYGRRYRYKLQPDMIDPREDHEECPTTDENLQQNPCFDQYQQTIKGGGKSEFSEKGNKSNLNSLQINHPQEKSQTSTECVKSFIYTRSLKRNQEIQSGGRPYQCSQCGRCFKERSTLKNHQRIHTGEKPYECPHCGRCFSKRDTLKNHQRIHTGEKPYKCSQCGKCFRLRVQLKQHQRVHSGEKPYECPQCGKYFCNGDSLKIHQRRHSGEKPYECPHCGRRFSKRDKLKNHQRIHTGEKPYECSQCGKCFRERATLKQHQRIHSGEKPYKCLECGERFTRSGTLKNHQRIHS